MTDNRRVRERIDELLDSDATPEEVCKSSPELLTAVRDKWHEIRRVRANLDALFPLPADDSPSFPGAIEQRGHLGPELAPGITLRGGQVGQGGGVADTGQVGVSLPVAELRLDELPLPGLRMARRGLPEGEVGL